MNREDKIIILGAGLAGLMAGYKLSQAGYKVILLEKESQVGGLGRTIKYKDYLFDFSAHRFHSNNEEIVNIMKSLLGDKLKKRKKRSRIYMFGKYLKYPFEPLNLFKNLPPTLALRGGVSYIVNRIVTKLNHKEIVSFKDWYIQNFGRVLYEIQCKSYASKLWQMDPSELSSDWASQRVSGFDLSKVIKVLFSKMLHRNISQDTLEEENKFPDLDPFYYPDYGYQMLSDALAEQIVSKGGGIRTEVEIKKIKMQTSPVVEYLMKGRKAQVEGEKIISTIPLDKVVDYIDPEVPASIKEKAKRLIYLNIIFVYLIFNKTKVSSDSWIYFPTEDIVFNRAVEFKNWSRHMYPDDSTALCLDITCRENSHWWNCSEQEVISKCIKGLEKAGLANRDEVIDSYLLKVKYAYPILELNYKKKLIEVVSFLERCGNFFALGRTGIFKYNNADNSMEMGLQLARAIINNEKNFTLLNYNVNNPSR